MEKSTSQPIEAEEPLPKVPGKQWRALGTCILCVAKITYPPDLWKAFICVVPGRNHAEEVQHVEDWGSELREDVARVVFKDFAHLPYDR